MSLKIYNSLTQNKDTFEPIEKGKVRMYVCGITAYDECHLGHARAAVVFDVIYRYFKHLGYDVTYVRNYTDVDDKIIKKSQETGESCKEITERYIASYEEQMKRLDVALPTEQPRATKHIKQMIELVSLLEKNGFAYRSGDDVFYRVRKFDEYGKLSHKKIDDLEIGARIEVNEQKEDPLDFVLWKASKPGEPKWPSPWGEGRPGWHLECSAMSMEYLGQSFDIHGGGRDLIFPHHENEIAQSEGATAKPFAKYWIHNGFVNINAEKMSKSLGNIRTIGAILDQWDPEVVRYFLLSAHYATPLDFTDKAMEDAQDALERFYKTLRRLEESPRGQDTADFNFDDLIKNCMNDDFNTAQLIGRSFEIIRKINTSLDKGTHLSQGSIDNVFKGFQMVGKVLGVLDSSPPQRFLDRVKQAGLSKIALTDNEINELLSERAAARATKDWNRADEIRKQLEAIGVAIEDLPDGGSVWSFKSRG